MLRRWQPLAEPGPAADEDRGAVGQVVPVDGAHLPRVPAPHDVGAEDEDVAAVQPVPRIEQPEGEFGDGGDVVGDGQLGHRVRGLGLQLAARDGEPRQVRDPAGLLVAHQLAAAPVDTTRFRLLRLAGTGPTFAGDASDACRRVTDTSAVVT